MAADPHLLNAVLDRIGYQPPPKPSRVALAALFAAWCRRVPFDNLLRLAHLYSNVPGPLPGFEPCDFLATYAATGIGSTCTPTSGGLWWVLTQLGYHAYRVQAIMHLGQVSRSDPNHTVLVVALEDHKYALDTAIMCGRPIPLTARHAIYPQLPHPLEVTPGGGTWSVRWLRPINREPVTMIVSDQIARDHQLLHTYEANRNIDLFNRAIYSKRNTAHGVLVFSGSDRHEIDSAGRVYTTDVTGKLPETLAAEMGYELSRVRQIFRYDIGKTP